MSRGDAKLPPAGLSGRALKPLLVPIGSYCWRISHKDAPKLDWSDSGSSRFSHPTLPCRVLYLARSKATAFWERFGEELRDQEPDDRGLAENVLAERVWKRVFLRRGRLQVLDLTDAGTLRMLGADLGTFLAPYEVTQAWAAALMHHPDAIDGLIYASRLNSPKRCIALFKRTYSDAAIGVAVVPPRPIDDPEVLTLMSREHVRLLR